MKKSLAREVIWLSLPSLIIVGAVLWKSGGQEMWRRKTLPRVTVGLEGIVLGREGPLASQNSWNDEEFYLMAGMVIHDPLRRTHDAAPVDVRHNQFIDQKGQVVSPSPFTYSYLGGYSRPEWLQKYPPGSQMVLSCDLDRVPLSRGEITLRSQWVLPDNRFQPFSVVVRPAWFCHAPRTLHLKSTRWLGATLKSREGVEIVLQADANTARLATNEQSLGSRVAWEQKALNSAAVTSVIRPHLLYNWSPRSSRMMDATILIRRVMPVSGLLLKRISVLLCHNLSAFVPYSKRLHPL